MIYFIGNKQLIESDNFDTCTIDHCLDYFKDKSEIQVDTETQSGKKIKETLYLPNPYEQKMFCYQLGDRENQYVIDNSLYPISLFKVLFEDKNKVKIFANAFFDLRFIIHYGINPKNIYDVFLAEMLLTLGKNMEKGYRSLEQMALRYCNIQLNKEIRGQIHWRGLDDTVIKYAAEDVSFMQDIKEKQCELIKKDKLERALSLENRYVITLARMSYNGYKINPIKWLEVNVNNKAKLEEYKEKLSAWVIENNHHEFTNALKSGILFSDMQYCTINWKSSKQVLPLFKKLGINVKSIDKKTSKEKDSVDIKILQRQSSKFSILPIYIRYKELEKEIDTYGENFIRENLNSVTKRVHSEYFQLLETGRISSSNPNLQNITSTDENGDPSPLRKCFVPEEGNDLIIADYSQQEPRILTEYCQDPTLIDFMLNKGGDTHAMVGTIISEYLLGYKTEVSKKNDPLVPRLGMKIRYAAKQINLKLNYGGTAFTLKDDLNCSQEEAQKIIDLINAGTPLREKYFKRCINFVKRYGYITTDEITHRRAYFDGFEEYKELDKIPYEEKTKEQISRYFKLRGSLERFARNIPIQGSAGSMTKIASIIFEDKLEENNLLDVVKMVNAVHDELNVESPKEHTEFVKQLLGESMIKAGELFCKTIPIKVDIFHGDNWGCKS